MKVRRALVQTAKTLLVLLVFLLAFGIYLFTRQDPGPSPGFDAARYTANSLIFLALMAIVSFTTSLVARK